MNIAAIREQYPQYNDMSDEQLSAAIQKKLGKQPAQQMSPLQQEVAKNPFMGNSGIGAFAGGLLSGANDVGRGAKQLLTKAGEFTGILPEGAEQKYTQKTDQERALEQGLLSGFFPEDPVAAGAGKIAGNAAPYALIPGLGVPSLLGRMRAGAAIGAGVGGTQYVPEGDSRMQNATIGGLLGGSMPAAGAALTSAPVKALAGGAVGLGEKVLKHLFPNKFENLIAKDLMTGIDAKTALKNKKIGDKLGLNLTPAEASGSETVKHAERALGKSREGQEALSAFKREEGKKQKNVIDKTLNTISSRKDDAAQEIKNAAIATEKYADKARKAISKPHYKASEDVVLPRKELDKLYLDYPVIQKAYKDVYKSPEYAPKLKGANKDSIKVVDLVRRRLKGMADTLESGGSRDKAALVHEARDKLTEAADKASGEFALARLKYSKGSKELEKIRESDIKRIAELPDNQLQNVSKIIFDRNETNPKVLNNLRDIFVKKNPEAWRRLIRNDMERVLSHEENGKTASNFFKTILAKDATFNQYLSATKGMPDAQKNLIYMRSAFKNLNNQIRDKNIISNEATVQSLPKEIGKAASKGVMSAYDKKAIEIITSGKWDKHLENINKTKDKKEKALKLAKLLGMKMNLNASSTAAVTSPGKEK